MKLIPATLLIASCAAQASTWHVSAQWDLRVSASDAQHAWTRDGLGKFASDRDADPIQAGPAFLRVERELGAHARGVVVVSAQGDRARVLDLNEAWLGWDPVPASAWRWRAKLGAFFPPNNLEIDYDSVGWTPGRTISASAINAWIGEEIRVQGLELAWAHNGRLVGSPHEWGGVLAVHGRNDPAGTLMAWRGWSVGDRIVGITESVRLADLPVYRSRGELAAQSRNLRIAREVDGRAGYYAGAHYVFSNVLRVEALGYDNRGDPLQLVNGQYSWRTRFVHAGVRVTPDARWTILAQAMRGDTLMGPDAVRLDYDAQYLLISARYGTGEWTIRHDRFQTRENPRDIIASDPNGERGRAWTLAHARPLNTHLTLVGEAVSLSSTRDARRLIGESVARTERSVTAAFRWRF
ncbi:MAG: hypothetical protein JNK75_00275 [Betaproteobacteria bacterium]|nr:hypothetical protein [Betaproteobacteria bacterium]